MSCKIDLPNNPYWKTIAADGRIEAMEVFRLTAATTGLRPEAARMGRRRLMLLTSEGGVPTDDSFVKELEKSVCADLSAGEQLKRRAIPFGSLAPAVTVTKGGSFQHDEVIEITREEFVRKYRLDIRDLAPDAYDTHRDRFILEGKRNTISLSRYCPLKHKRHLRIRSEEPLPSRHYGRLEGFLDKISTEGSKVLMDGDHLTVERGPMTERQRDALKEYYRKNEPPALRAKAFSTINRLYEESQQAGGSYEFEGPLTEQARDELLSELTFEPDREMVRTAFVRSRQVTAKDVADLESFSYGLDRLAEWYSNRQVLSPDQFKEGLFEILKAQVSSRLPAEKREIYRQRLSAYADSELRRHPEFLTLGHLFQEGYQMVLDFKESVDISERDEAQETDPFTSIRQAAQGPFSSTCGVYAVLSLVESLGLLQSLKRHFSLHTFADLDRFTFSYLDRYASHPEAYTLNASFRDQGIPYESVPEILRDILNKLVPSGRYQFEEIGPRGRNLTASDFKQYLQGFIAVINTEVGPHAVHLLGYDPRTATVRYYDPIGQDGSRKNIKEVPLGEFHSTVNPSFPLMTLRLPRKSLHPGVHRKF